MARTSHQTDVHTDDTEDIHAIITPRQWGSSIWLHVHTADERITVYMTAEQMKAIAARMIQTANEWEAKNAPELETV